MLSFMQTITYPGKQDEDFVETRIRIYEQQKNKFSLTLLPDKHYPNPEECGWQVEEKQ